MQISEQTLHLLTKLAMQAALKAGEIIATFPRDQLEIYAKQGGTSEASKLLTSVDQLCQQEILAILSPSCKTYDLACLTEEAKDDKQRLAQDYFWCIDPLDGTLPYTEGSTGYAISIALVSKDGQPQLGVVYDPVQRALYHAILHCGAFRNAQPWHPVKSATTLSGSFHLINDRSFVQHKQIEPILQECKAIGIALGCPRFETTLTGGAVMNALWVLEQSPACYFKFPKSNEGGGSLWDYAATACIYQEVGAVVSDIFGKPLELNRTNSTFMNHRGLLFATHEQVASKIRALYGKLNPNQ